MTNSDGHLAEDTRRSSVPPLSPQAYREVYLASIHEGDERSLIRQHGLWLFEKTLELPPPVLPRQPVLLRQLIAVLSDLSSLADYLTALLETLAENGSGIEEARVALKAERLKEDLSCLVSRVGRDIYAPTSRSLG